MSRCLFVLTALLSCASLAPTDGAGRSDEGQPWAAPPLEQAVTVRQQDSGETLSFEALLDRLAEADVVFLGETHIDETTHRVEHAVYQGLLARKQGRVVLAMEMFERDAQAHLDAYLAGEIDETTFLDRVQEWANYGTSYRPLIETAREAGRPVVASNFPRSLRRRMAMEGNGVLENLTESEKHLAPAELHPNTPEYWRRVDNAVRGHLGMMGGSSGEDDQRLYSTQTLWDNAMGEACADALDRHPGDVVLHINGGFHSQYWDGTARQLRLRKPEARVITVAIVPDPNPATAVLGGKPRADYVVLAEDRAADLNDGTWSVSVSREISYRLSLPPGANAKAPVPLLIWLSDDGLMSADGLALWKGRLGDEAAIAVLEPLYPAVQPDLSVGGRWFWPDSFASDITALTEAVERTWGYLLRNLPVDADRVCLAGEGTGATVVAAVALLTQRMSVQAVSLSPRRYAKIKDVPLPLPEYRGKDAPEKSLRVIAGAQDRDWWLPELGEYTAIGFQNEFSPATEDPFSTELAAENALRAALDLSPAASRPASSRRYLTVETDSPRARHWARLLALRAAAAEDVAVAVVDTPPAGASPVPTEITPGLVAAGGTIPRCPGPFGGTTVLLLPDDTSPETQNEWLALEENDPLQKFSRFHRTRIATASGERSLASVLAKLEAENRSNVMIVPATFCADAETMRSSQRSVQDLDDRMTLHWLPGLGGQDLPLPEPAEPKSSASAPPPQDEVVRHRLSVVLDPETHELQVLDTIELPAALSVVGSQFGLNSALSIRSSEPAVVRVADAESGSARYELTAASPDGILDLSYGGSFDFKLSDQKEEYTRGFRETRGTVGPEGVYLDAGSEWVPGFGERMVEFSLVVEMPDDWHVISQGSGTSRNDKGRAIWRSDDRMSEIYLVGGPLVVESEAAGSVEALVYLHEQDDALSRKYLDATASYLEMYRGLIGPYPYQKFALVENFWETGYGMPSFTLLGPQVIRFPFILSSSYPHEILHNWWGNSVFVDYQSGNWCEGLTAYMADHLIQEQRGQGALYRRSTLQKYRDYVKEGRDFPLSEFRSRHSAATEAVGYGKALMTFHMLRRSVGDDAFRSALQRFYRTQRGRRASFDDLRSAVEAEVDQDLQSFFEQWVQRTGAPTLTLQDVSVLAEEDGFRISGSLHQLQQEPPYSLNVPVQVSTVAGHQSFQVWTQANHLPFELRVEDRPLTLSADPYFDLFRQLDPRETPASIGQIFGEPEILAVLSAADDSSRRDDYRQLMESWQTDSHNIEIVTDDQLAALPQDRAVWLLGSSNRLAHQLAEAEEFTEVTSSGVRIAGENTAFAGNSTVIIWRHPQNLEKAVGWLTVDPEAAFPGMSRKLPHYGKYSYLAFEGTEPSNTLKGQWEPTDSPMVVDLRGDWRGAAPPAPAEEREALAELPPVFSQRALVAHVEWLASPQRQGRGLGSSGLADSAQYIADAMARAGLEPGGDDGTWLQRFTVPEGPEGRPVDAVNVIGVLRGTNTAWRGQSVVLSAHYDHLGTGWPDVHAGDEGKVHPGADDNASGVAVMLELARNLAQGEGGSRDLVCIAFSAEESGRLGSKYYVDHPISPLEDTRGVINLDAVGRLFDGEIAVHGTGTADEWQHVFRGCGFVTGVRAKNVPGAAEGSDQASFIERGVPGVQFFTGAHGDYHRPSDTADKIDAAGLVKVATFLKEAVVYLREREEPLTVRIEGAASQPVTGTSRPGERRVSFGTVPEFEFQGPGVKVTSLVPGSPAEKAGLQAGDILIQIDDQTLADLRAFSDQLKTLSAGQEVTATVIRGGEEVKLKVVVTAR